MVPGFLLPGRRVFGVARAECVQSEDVQSSRSPKGQALHQWQSQQTQVDLRKGLGVIDVYAMHICTAITRSTFLHGDGLGPDFDYSKKCILVGKVVQAGPGHPGGGGCVTRDLSYEREGAGEVGQITYQYTGIK